MRVHLLLAIFLLVYDVAFSASAKDKKPGKGKGSKTEAAAPAPVAGDTRYAFTVQERQIIAAYVGEKTRPPGRGRGPGFLPPGLEKKYARTGRLPPGWEKKVVVGSTMPREVYVECSPLPGDLQLRLPVPPVGTVTVCVEGKIARILQATMEILDVFDIRL